MTTIFGHRGSPDPAAGIRENTLDSFRRARALGADGVELDVRRTADGVHVVHHDPVVDGVGAIAEHPASALPASVPDLATALDACEGLTVNVELKNLPGEPGFDPDEVLAAEVAAVLADRPGPPVVVSSFWPPSLAAVHRVRPELATGLLLASWFEADQIVEAALAQGCSAVHPHVDLVSAELVEQARRAGLGVATWTVNEPAALAAAFTADVDVVITDDVALALAAAGRAPGEGRPRPA